MPLATASRRRARAPEVDAPATPARRAPFVIAASRRSRPALAAGGILIVVLCAAGGAALAAHAGHRAPYLALSRPVTVGTPVSASDLATVELDPGGGLSAIPASEESSVIGLRASETLPAGSLLDAAELTSSAPIGKGEAVVGASLAANQMPADLQPGDRVMVVLTTSSGAPISPLGAGGAAGNAKAGAGVAGSSGSGLGTSGTGGSTGGSAAGGGSGTAAGQVLTEATVVDVLGQASGGTGAASPTDSAAPTSGTSVVSLEVPVASAASVTAASAADEISLAIVPGAPTGHARSSR